MEMDRLSELPDSLIFDIFDFLPMTDVVRTTILSHRWKNLWKTAPNLNFDESLCNFGTDKFRNIVNGALSRWRGNRVHKFKFWSPVYMNSLLARDVDLWLRFAIDNGVEEFYIRCATFKNCVPQCVYSCLSLKKMCLDWCNLEIDGNVEWNRLKCLTIRECFGVTQHVIDQILCGSPLLEVLTLSLVHKDDNLNMSFRSTSLKELSIRRSARCDTSKYAVLRICTPNLERLTISGDAYSKYVLEDVSSLTHATLAFSGRDVTDWRNHIDLQLFDFLPSVQHVESIPLLDWQTQGIFTLLDSPVSPLLNVKFLKLNDSFEEHEDIVRLLEIFPNIKTLILQEKMNGGNRSNARSNLEFIPDDSTRPFATELTTVEVTWNGCDFSIFPLLETLLKQASKLEKMAFRLRVEEFNPPSSPSNALFSASQKLLGVQRSSPNAELIF